VKEQEWKLRDEEEEEEKNEKRILVRVCCTDLIGNEEVSRQEKRERERERERESLMLIT